jgi:hypothetical protein
MSTIAFAQSSKQVSEYLSVPGPIVFDGKSYNLIWSSHPAANFYKQEYIVKGDNVNKFKSMILMDVITGETNIKNVVGNKASELQKMKQSNPVVNYEVIENPKTGEYMIDFLLSANGPDGTMSIVERNVYRYKTFADKAGHKGILLFGISTRGYDEDITSFFSALKTNRTDLISKVSSFKLPEISISK